LDTYRSAHRAWYDLYGSLIGGIFFDEGLMIATRSFTATSTNGLRVYSGAYTVLNIGSTMPKCFEESTDTLMMFESSYESYKTAYVDNGWTTKNLWKLWYIIYKVLESGIGAIAALPKQHGVFRVQIAEDIMNGPPYTNERICDWNKDEGG
jgi:hypothetical protein